MSAADRSVFTEYYGVKAHRACGSDISQVRRDRYYWLSWRVPACNGVAVEERDDYSKVSFTATIAPSELWADAGWTFEGDADERIPTFMRRLPKGKPTFTPTHIDNTQADAARRWAKDSWRYPPYHYKRQFLLRSQKHPSASSARPPHPRGSA